MPTTPARRNCCKKLKELGLKEKNIKRKFSPKADNIRKEVEKGIRTGKPKAPKRKPTRRK